MKEKTYYSDFMRSVEGWIGKEVWIEMREDNAIYRGRMGSVKFGDCSVVLNNCERLGPDKEWSVVGVIAILGSSIKTITPKF